MLGVDPDPNIRSQMQRDHRYFGGADWDRRKSIQDEARRADSRIGWSSAGWVGGPTVAYSAIARFD
jgi:hypothetical protein